MFKTMNNFPLFFSLYMVIYLMLAFPYHLSVLVPVRNLSMEKIFNH